MPATNSDNKQWTDPKDYGLPFVEITPLRAKSILKEKESTSVISEPVVGDEVIVSIPDISELKNESIPAEEPIAIEPISAEEPKEIEPIPVEEPIEFNSREAEVAAETSSKLVDVPFENKIKSEIPRPVSPIAEEKKKTASWVWAVFILAFGLVSFIIWQIQSQTPLTSTDAQSENPQKPTESESSAESVVAESTVTDQNQPLGNQDSIPTLSNSNPNISKPAETGTTIAVVASGNLIRIESKAERPQYYIIVGSLPNEKLAIEEASQYFSKSPEMYLISPDEGGRNYRLGISKFASFKLAAEELERIKSQYTEELWILKY